MMSLKPPWKRKNPLMEKACRAYHKQTAPAKAVEALKKLEVVRAGRKLEKEVTHSSKYKEGTKTTILFKGVKAEKGSPWAVGQIIVQNGELDLIIIAKYGYALPVEFNWKGEQKGKIGGDGYGFSVLYF